ncbi:hypothetical protein A3195_13650 [Candidatus Thiodiazotropha endoloripes]|nr:hypothetical protein [Candidatus Thiodiazotropha endoloripes]ODB86634.1 hypothetical protein A3195_13650 [Candidatus Thiodiazotropha endoloripes]ODB88664.1 hypothetical protein A3193_07440 [Candidatus Thiodiazotropha endoloripes]
MSIRKALEKWNGKSVDEISRLYDLYGTDNDFARIIIPLFRQPDCESGATWMMKRYLEDHKHIDDASQDEVFKTLKSLNH